MNTLFDPSSVAIIGASADPDKISGLPVKYLKSHGYNGRIYPINPNHDEVGGYRCYPDVDSLPEIPDLALVILPARLVVDVVEDCVEVGVGTVLIVSSGFSEVGTEVGRAAEARLADLAETNDTTVVGPNSQGVINFQTGLAASFTPALARDEMLTGEVSFVTQSGAFGGALTTLLQDHGIGLNRWLATGNETHTESLDAITEFVTDDRTDIVAGYIEGFEDGRKLIELKRTERGIDLPIIFLKVGESEHGREAAASHTGKLAGRHEVYEAVFRETGVMAVDDIDAFVDVVRATRQMDSLPREGIGIVTTSGGAGVHIADIVAEENLTLAQLGERTVNQIESWIPDYGSARNPVDITGQVVNDPDALDECIEALLEDDGVGTLILQLTNASGEQAATFARRIVSLSDGKNTPVCVSWTGGVDKTEGYELLTDAGIPVFENPARCVRTVASLRQFARSKPLLNEARTLPARLHRESVDETDGERVMTEIEGKKLLSEYGIATPDEQVIECTNESIDLEFPLVTKLVAPELKHRNQVGAIRTDIRTHDELETACERLFERADSLGVEQPRVAVQEQVSGDLEVSFGITDSDFGQLIMFGRGGMAIEEQRDVTFRTLPIIPGQARRMLTELRTVSSTELTDSQSSALVNAAVALSTLYSENRWIREADINPLIVGEEGVTAVDALFLS